MNIVFFGSSGFAVPSLRALNEGGYNISCVITQTDKKKGRGLHLEPTPVKLAANELGLNIHQPVDINASEEIKSLKSLNPELFVVVSYGQILSRDILAIPKELSVNAHASILPKYRGAAPISWAIIRGEKTTGVSIIKMTEKMDAGPIIMQETIEMNPDDSVIKLEDKLSQLASQLLLKSVRLIAVDKHTLIEQDKEKVTFAPKLKKEDGLINWMAGSEDIYNLVRGCAGWPGAFTYYKGKLLKIHKAIPIKLKESGKSRDEGRVVELLKSGIIVGCSRGYLTIQQLQLEGKKIMAAQDFITGHKICVGDILGK